MLNVNDVRRPEAEVWAQVGREQHETAEIRGPGTTEEHASLVFFSSAQQNL